LELKYNLDSFELKNGVISSYLLLILGPAFMGAPILPDLSITQTHISSPP
tara:strand:- start:322 stop:471 length:150 start_codon:yes stop_codon:yes gene_type:complete